MSKEKKVEELPNWKRVFNFGKEVAIKISTQIENESKKRRDIKNQRERLKQGSPAIPLEQEFRKDGASYDPENPYTPININESGSANGETKFKVDDKTGMYSINDEPGLYRASRDGLKFKKAESDFKDTGSLVLKETTITQKPDNLDSDYHLSYELKYKGATNYFVVIATISDMLDKKNLAEEIGIAHKKASKIKDEWIKSIDAKSNIIKIRGNTVIDSGISADAIVDVDIKDSKSVETYTIKTKCFNCQKRYIFTVPQGTVAHKFISEQVCKNCNVKYMRAY